MAILLVDDDRDLVDLLSFVLQRAGLDAMGAFDVAGALKRLEGSHNIELAVLDVNLGTGDGFELLKQIRHKTDIPIIMLTSRDSEEDIVRGLELGADDYITKPFRHRELVARIRSHLRKRAPTRSASGQATLSAGSITMNVGEHTAQKDGEPLDLTPTEFRLLQYLVQNAGRALTTPELLRHVWGYEDTSAAAVARVAVHRLRRKIGDDAAEPQLLVTLPGVGIRFGTTPGGA